jgi:hypothetical protein
MTLEQRLEDSVFLERTVVNTIEETVEFTRLFCKVREHAGVVNDDQYETAKSFLKDYNKCKFYGATPEFRQDLLSNMIAAKSGRVFRKATSYLVLAAAGSGLVYLGYSAESPLLIMAGAGISLGSLVTAFFFIPKCEYQKTVLIYQVMKKNPEVLNKALKKLYEKEKNV